VFVFSFTVVAVFIELVGGEEVREHYIALPLLWSIECVVSDQVVTLSRLGSESCGELPRAAQRTAYRLVAQMLYFVRGKAQF
jgi:hypothetical protein